MGLCDAVQLVAYNYNETSVHVFAHVCFRMFMIPRVPYFYQFCGSYGLPFGSYNIDVLRAERKLFSS